MSIASSGGCAPAWAAWYSRPSFLTRSAILATSSRMRRPRQQQASIACITNRERGSVQLVQEGRQVLARRDGSLRCNDLVVVGGRADVNRRAASAETVESDPYLPLLRQFCRDAQDGIATTI